LAEVGATARRSRRVTERDIELFTELTGDRNPLHYDEATAQRSRFGGGTVVLDGTALVWTEQP
jgi:acyl dehydratase